VALGAGAWSVNLLVRSLRGLFRYRAPRHQASEAGSEGSGTARKIAIRPVRHCAVAGVGMQGSNGDLGMGRIWVISFAMLVAHFVGQRGRASP
jgi:hypothetical protein